MLPLLNAGDQAASSPALGAGVRGQGAGGEVERLLGYRGGVIAVRSMLAMKCRCIDGPMLPGLSIM